MIDKRIIMPNIYDKPLVSYRTMQYLRRLQKHPNSYLSWIPYEILVAILEYLFENNEYNYYTRLTDISGCVGFNDKYYQMTIWPLLYRKERTSTIIYRKDINDIQSVYNNQMEYQTIRILYTDFNELGEYNYDINDIKYLTQQFDDYHGMNTIVLHHRFGSPIYIPYSGNIMIKRLFPLSTYNLNADVEHLYQSHGHDKMIEKEEEEIILRQLKYGNIK
jgi:hypothetical protein